MKKSIGPKTLIYPNPVLLVGTYDENNKPNLMAVSWGSICCSDPPCVAVSIRQARYTYNNIINRKAFTVCIPSESQVNIADYCGIYSGRYENKFEKNNLTEVRSQVVDAPYADEFPVVLHCKLKEFNNLGVHTQFIGEIIDVSVDENVLNDKGIPEINRVLPIIYDYGTKTYYGIGKKLIDSFTNIKR